MVKYIFNNVQERFVFKHVACMYASYNVLLHNRVSHAPTRLYAETSYGCLMDISMMVSMVFVM